MAKEVSRAAPRRRRAQSRGRRAFRGLAVTAWLVVVVAASATLLAALVGRVDAWVGEAAAIATATAYAWGLAARTAGRPVVFGLLCVVLGVGVVALDADPLRNGAALATAVLTAVFAVMATVPATGIVGAVRETGVALVVAAVGSMATIAWAPAVALHRFEYVVLGLSLVAALVTVHRLGAGVHGLGTRGVVGVIGGGLLLGATFGYAELLQHYGTHEVVQALDDSVRWSHHHLGAFPRPIVALVGVPALVWGTHMRSRRPQGWWVCAFGAGLTAPVAYALADPGRSLAEILLATAYAGVIGLVLGWALIRLDLRLTSPRTGRGRRLAEPDDEQAVQPEPGRTQALW